MVWFLSWLSSGGKPAKNAEGSALRIAETSSNGRRNISTNVGVTKTVPQSVGGDTRKGDDARSTGSASDADSARGSGTFSSRSSTTTAPGSSGGSGDFGDEEGGGFEGAGDCEHQQRPGVGYKGRRKSEITFFEQYPESDGGGGEEDDGDGGASRSGADKPGRRGGEANARRAKSERQREGEATGAGGSWGRGRK